MLTTAGNARDTTVGTVLPSRATDPDAAGRSPVCAARKRLGRDYRLRGGGVRTVVHALRTGARGFAAAHPWRDKPVTRVGAEAKLSIVRHTSGDGACSS
jgi:hypothetical protein